MTINSVFENNKNRIRRALNRNANPVTLGDANGNVPYLDAPTSGLVYARRQQADGEWGPSFLVRGSALPGTNSPGIPVELGIDKQRQQRIEGPDFVGMQVLGINPTQYATTDPNANNAKFVNQQFITTAFAQIVEGSLKVAIRGWIVKIAGVFYKLEGQIDFTGSVTSTGNHCVASIAWMGDYSALEVQYSTAKDSQIPLTLADVNEAWALMSDPLHNVGLWAFKLAEGQTALSDADRFLDLRGLINVSSSDLSVTDGSTTVSNVNEINFITGATVTDAGSGVADVNITGGGGGGSGDYILIQDQQAAGTHGGTFTSGARRTRVLNTIVEDTTGAVTLSSNQFTLPAGSYRITARAPAFYVNRHQAWLYNVTDSVDVAVGSSMFTTNQTADGIVTDSVIMGRFTIASAKTFEIQHRGETTEATVGFGVSANFGSVEVYTSVELIKE